MTKRAKTPAAAEAIILAGGLGARMGGDKQYLLLGGRPMIERTVGTFVESGLFSGVILALGPDNRKKYGAAWERAGVKVAGAGETRTESLRNAFALVSPGAELVAVHDGARPLVTQELIAACLSAAAGSGAAVPAVPLKDTVKKLAAGGRTFAATLERSSLAAVQTPQCYRRAILAELLARAKKGTDYSDESQVLEEMGVAVAAVPSDYRNIKVTTPEDLLIAEAFMKSEKPLRAPRGKFCRAGFGYDIHRMVEGRPLILGGVKIEHTKGLLGHSDGDVVLHAACDAMLGAISAGEIGVYFPPTDLTLMGISSSEIAKKTMEILASKKAFVVNLDITILAEEPKLKGHYEAIRKSVAAILGMPEADISVKAKSREGLGDIGHGEAIVCYAVASVLR